MPSLDESRNYKNAGDRKIEQPFFLKPLPITPLPVTLLPEGEKPFTDTTTEEEYKLGIDNVPTLRLPAKNIDELPTTASLKAVYEAPSSSYTFTDGLPIDQQPAWYIPLVTRAENTRRMPRLHSKVSGIQDYAFLIRTLVKSSGIYALASLASPLVSLVLLPFLTHKLSHTEYGAFAVLTTIIALTAGVTQFGLNNAFFRAYSCDYESKDDRLGVVSTVVVLLLLTSIPITILTMINAPWLANLLLKSSSFSEPVRLAALIVLMQNLTVPGFSWLRAESRAASYSVLSIANLLVNLGTTVVLVGIFHMGIAGAFFGTAGGYAVVVICTLPVVLIRAGLHLRVDITQNLLSFGLPLVSNFVSVWILQLSDRYLLSHFGSLAQTGSYAVAYTLGGVLNVLVLSPFSLAWPTAMFAIAKREDAVHVFRLVFHWFSLGLLIVTFALSLMATFILNIFFPPAYHSAAPVIPIVAVSIMFYGVYSYFTVGIGIKRKTWFAVLFTTFAALVNVGLNLVLIPRFGSMGAAESTLVAYVVLAMVAYVVNQWVYPIPFEVGRFTIALIVGIPLYLGGVFWAQSHDIYSACAIYIGALGLYGGCLFLIGKFPARTHNNTKPQS